MTGFWIALAVLLTGVVAGIAYAVLRGIAMWRRIKRTGRAFSVESERIARISAQIDDAHAHGRTVARRYTSARDAGWSSQVARRAHNPEVAGSNPAPATTKALHLRGFRRSAPYER